MMGALDAIGRIQSCRTGTEDWRPAPAAPAARRQQEVAYALVPSARRAAGITVHHNTLEQPAMGLHHRISVLARPAPDVGDHSRGSGDRVGSISGTPAHSHEGGNP